MAQSRTSNGSRMSLNASQEQEVLSPEEAEQVLTPLLRPWTEMQAVIQKLDEKLQRAQALKQKLQEKATRAIEHLDNIKKMIERNEMRCTRGMAAQLKMIDTVHLKYRDALMQAYGSYAGMCTDNDVSVTNAVNAVDELEDLLNKLAVKNAAPRSGGAKKAKKVKAAPAKKK